jgi:D-3-phosphoglycerate dehydrogenase / 2-oxoglutarate reductase
MPTLVLDFDSTLISCESLEAIVRPNLVLRPEVMDEVAQITNLGMEGQITFGESLRRRLRLVAPTRQDVELFSDAARRYLTPGMDRLVADMHARGVSVRIVTGALREAALPLARLLGIPDARVHGVSVAWTPEGHFLGLRPDDPFTRSKLEGVAHLSGNWPRPRVGVGDGMTDYELMRAGALDHFVAFTQHRRREPVLATGATEARDVDELRTYLEELLGAGPAA